MWYQKDWFTGSDYYNLKEKQIHAEEIEIKKPDSILAKETISSMQVGLVYAVTPIFGSTEINIK